MTLITALHTVFTLWLIWNLFKAWLGLKHYRKVKQELSYYKQQAFINKEALKVANQILFKNKLEVVTVEYIPCQSESTTSKS